MALEKRTGLLAEILLRFSDGTSHDAPLGAFNGAAVREATVIVDTETGAIEPGSYRELEPRPLSEEDLASIVTKESAAFLAGFQALQKDRDTLAEQLAAAQAAADAAGGARDALATQLFTAQADAAALRRDAEELRRDRDALAKRIAAGQAALAPQQS